MNDKEIEDDLNIKFMDEQIKKDEDVIKKNRGKEIRHDKKK